MRRVRGALIVGDFRKIVDCGDFGRLWMGRVRGLLIVGKDVWDLGGVWMQWESGLLIVERKFGEAEEFECGG